jgi:hypothetical protein
VSAPVASVSVPIAPVASSAAAPSVAAPSPVAASVKAAQPSTLSAISNTNTNTNAGQSGVFVYNALTNSASSLASYLFAIALL